MVTGAPPETDLLREETFGPVAPIVPVDSLDEAIALANGTRFGLGANVYTRDLETAVRCMREIKAGTVWINDPLTDNDAGPFGGFKQSGLAGSWASRGSRPSRRPSTCTSRRGSGRRSGGTPTGEFRSAARRGAARGAGEREGEGRVLVEAAAATPLGLQIGETAQRAFEGLAVRLARKSHGLLELPGGALQMLTQVLLRHAGVQQLDHPVHLAQAPDDRVCQPPGRLARGA